MYAYSVVYPNEFKASEPLVAGHYDVEWYATIAPPAGATRLQAALIKER